MEYMNLACRRTSARDWWENYVRHSVRCEREQSIFRPRVNIIEMADMN
jgi:hypothetical protein